MAKFSEHDSSVLDAHGFGFHCGVVSLAYFLHLYFEPTVRERRRVTDKLVRTISDGKRFLRDLGLEYRVASSF